MNAEFIKSAENDSLPAGQVPLNVFLAYEDFPTGIHALRTFDAVFLEEGDHPRNDTQMVWKFDLLKIKRLREAAIREAAQSHMVIISAHGTADLPLTVQQWLEGLGERASRGTGGSGGNAGRGNFRSHRTVCDGIRAGGLRAARRDGFFHPESSRPASPGGGGFGNRNRPGLARL